MYSVQLLTKIFIPFLKKKKKKWKSEKEKCTDAENAVVNDIYCTAKDTGLNSEKTNVKKGKKKKRKCPFTFVTSSQYHFNVRNVSN